ARLTEVCAGHGANLEESRMAILGGEFAAIALVTIDAAKIETLILDLEALKKEGISVTTRATKPLNADRFEGYGCFELTLFGADHEGIVHRVSSYLKDSGVNIESLETSVRPAPETGTPLFNLKAFITAPPSRTIDALRKDLNEIGRSESVDIEICES